MSDAIDDFLDSGVLCKPEDSLRSALRARTTRLVRRRRRLKQLAWAGALAACFLAGMATMYVLVPRAPAAAGSAPVTVAVKKDEMATTKPEPPSALDIELQARAQSEQRVAKLRQAAGLYLAQQDVASALRCYTQALNNTDPQALDFSPDDTWLEMALKNARRKEKARAN
jgi:hypothetical protein